MKNYISNKGSITVEATIAFTVFVAAFFLLLTIVKLVMLEYALTYVANESAKSIADVSYVVGILNTWQDEMDDSVDSSANDRMMSFGENLTTKTMPKLISTFLGLKRATNTGDKKVIGKANGKLAKTIGKEALSLMGSFISEGVKDLYGIFRENIAEIKTDYKYNFVRQKVEEGVDNCGIRLDKDKLILEVVKFPETKREYTLRGAYFGYLSNDLLPGRDFDKDDAVVIVSYKTAISFPFFPTYEVKFRKIAIEKCWLNGDNGIITEFKAEGVLAQSIDLLISRISGFLTDKEVYIADNGRKYHSAVCPKLGDAHTNKVKEYVAKDNGYEACKFCNH